MWNEHLRQLMRAGKQTIPLDSFSRQALAWRCISTPLNHLMNQSLQTP
ncbi:hypothetical protein PLANPX_3421 [Lacipirellula parvula]|uniref:Uncharacterized protein n=1 Tax=Lacipirellula parvula TaxID=2650471 RepID=A0A5K7XLJ7_9BACT|nr:hypothetical protein PLANPX_3421 [Lacipirellula parvula]